ncbi:MAG: LPS export ABC transporter periplasmic protein LptC [Flavobacteriales bacterium]|nr:LPS export ABC transporter periplasmic protein LptC [Flavobacteriales bacterium]
MARNITALILKSISALIIAEMLFACENKIEDVELFSNKGIIAMETGDDVEILFSENGIIRVKMLVKRMERYGGDRPYIDMKNGVQLFFFDSAGSTSSTLQSDKAINYINEDRLEASGNVVVTNNENQKIQTEFLVWEADEKDAEKKIWSDKFVTITTKNEILMGDGFEARQDFSKYKIKKLKGTVTIKEEEEDNED